MTSPSSRNTLPGSAFSLVRAKLTRVVARPAARVLFFNSGVSDLRPIRAALAVVAKVVRPLSLVSPLQEASEPDDHIFCCQADVDRSFISFRVVAHETNHEGNTWKTHSQNVATYREHRAEKFSDYRTENFGDRL